MKLPKKTWQERFDEKFKIFEQVSGDEADGTFAVEEDRERVKDFIAQILEEDKERLVEIILDKLLKLEARHKEKACIIANSNEYDEINMARFIENPLVRVIAFNHIDFVRELRDIISQDLLDMMKFDNPDSIHGKKKTKISFTFFDW